MHIREFGKKYKSETFCLINSSFILFTLFNIYTFQYMSDTSLTISDTSVRKASNPRRGIEVSYERSV